MMAQYVQNEYLLTNAIEVGINLAEEEEITAFYLRNSVHVIQESSLIMTLSFVMRWLILN